MFIDFPEERAASIIMAKDLSYTLKIEAFCSSESSVNVYHTAWCSIPRHSDLHVNVKYKYNALCITTLPASGYLESMLGNACCRSLYQICTCQ